jgi:hypothetical protein
VFVEVTIRGEEKLAEFTRRREVIPSRPGQILPFAVHILLRPPHGISSGEVGVRLEHAVDRAQ